MNTESFRALLNDRLADVVRRNHKVNHRLRHVSGIPDDWEERAVALQDEEVLEGLDHEARAEISAIRAALERLNNGTYGVCAGCGDGIAEARLRALPFAITCVECAAG